MNVEVLYGGVGGERAVSLCSGARVAAALRARGAHVSATDWNGVVSAELLQKCGAADAVFLALHGGAGENGELQRVLDQNGIRHYTGTGGDGAALAMAKPRAKAAVAAFGVPVAKGALLDKKQAVPPLSYPFVVKPAEGGSSIGFSLVKTDAEWRKLTPFRGFLCEEYLPGREFTVGILEECCLPVVEIRPRGGLYDYAHKYQSGAAEELCPAPITAAERDRLFCLATVAFRALGLRDYARLDFKEDADGVPRFLEANTLPGMTETSLFPLAAAAKGITFEVLCERMAALAALRKIKK